MGKYYLLILISLILSACNDDDCPENPLVTPDIEVVEAGVKNYAGFMEVYPCSAGTTKYYGNYSADNVQRVFPGSYIMQDGIPATVLTPVRLPAGNYSMLYWGYPTMFDYTEGYVTPPALTLGTDFSTTYFSLRKSISDTTYHQSVDLVFGRQDILIGKEKMFANLSRTTARITVSVTNSSGEPYTEAIDSMWVHIGGVAIRINSATGVADLSQVGTVHIGLSNSSNKLSWRVTNASLFPTTSNPLMSLFVRLKNGNITTFTQALTNTLSASTNTTIMIILNGTMTSETSTGVFTVANWIEQSETITAPPI